VEQRPYLSYLLRLWQARSENGPAWRASLESPLTRECIGFATLSELFAFLEEQVSSAAKRKGTFYDHRRGGAACS